MESHYISIIFLAVFVLIFILVFIPGIRSMSRRRKQAEADLDEAGFIPCEEKTSSIKKSLTHTAPVEGAYTVLEPRRATVNGREIFYFIYHHKPDKKGRITANECFLFKSAREYPMPFIVAFNPSKMTSTAKNLISTAMGAFSVTDEIKMGAVKKTKLNENENPYTDEYPAIHQAWSGKGVSLFEGVEEDQLDVIADAAAQGFHGFMHNNGVVLLTRSFSQGLPEENTLKERIEYVKTIAEL